MNNNYQQDLRVLYTFVPNKPFGQLLDISHTHTHTHTKLISLKTFDSDFSYVEVRFIDQNSKPL